MSLFDAIGGKSAQGGQMTPQQAMQQLRADPAATLKQAGLSIPDGMHDPNQIVNHLIQSGQVSNQRLMMAQRMMGMMRR